MRSIEKVAVSSWQVNNDLAAEFGDTASDWRNTAIEFDGMRRLLNMQLKLEEAETAQFLSNIARSIEAALINQEHDEDFDDYNDKRMQK